MNLDGRTAWPNMTMFLTCASFVAANLGWPAAQLLWSDGAPAIGVFMGIGIGIRPAWKAANRYIEQRYSSRTEITVPDGEEP